MKTEYLIFIFLSGLGFILRLILIMMVIFLMAGCRNEELPVKENDQKDTDIVEGSWVTYSPYKWTHDGQPHQAFYCTVFSDGCSEEMKAQAGALADDKFLEVLQWFDFSDPENLRFPTEREKIDVYINRSHPENLAAAYWGSIIITVRTSELNTGRYAYLFKHELTHVFEFLIEGTVNLAGEMWFTEGIAIVIGGGLNRINNVDDLELWITKNEHSPNKGNPITIKKWEDYPEGADKTGYYTVFEVVMEYLLSPEGLNKTGQDVLNLFYDLRENIPFEQSFEENFGISTETLEDEIFDRLRSYFKADG
jgi:hypothetical protein